MTNPKAIPSPQADNKAKLRLWLKLLKTTRSVEAELRERLRKEFQTTLPRFDVMAALSQRPEGLKMSEISDLLKVSNGNVTGIVDRLVDDGIALREPVPGDRRANKVRLTPKGLDEFDRQASEHEKWVNALLGELDATEATNITDKLDLLIRDRGK
ncbi:MAG: MarR family transcriptional regulator [Rhodobacteraceae bacterium]|nr:MarR family transcriptional regulator [Paracoccaceae bacterium]